jgi:hypothetical protein
MVTSHLPDRKYFTTNALSVNNPCTIATMPKETRFNTIWQTFSGSHLLDLLPAADIPPDEGSDWQNLANELDDHALHGRNEAQADPDDVNIYNHHYHN